jgi:hypothetical protein
MAGQLGIKKNKDEGLRLLREAARSADRDCPEPLYVSTDVIIDSGLC